MHDNAEVMVDMTNAATLHCHPRQNAGFFLTFLSTKLRTAARSLFRKRLVNKQNRQKQEGVQKGPKESRIIHELAGRP